MAGVEGGPPRRPKPAAPSHRHLQRFEGAVCVQLARTVYIYTVYIQYVWQVNDQRYGHIRCVYTVLANPKYAFVPTFGTSPPNI
jgi:hypothetical protein